MGYSKKKTGKKGKREDKKERQKGKAKNGRDIKIKDERNLSNQND